MYVYIYTHIRWGQRRKTNPKRLGSVFSLCCRAGIDAALVKADFFSAGVPTIENKFEQIIQNTKVASAKVAFDTVRASPNESSLIFSKLSRCRPASIFCKECTKALNDKRTVRKNSA